MVLENEKYIINIDIDETYTIDSTDNRFYDVILNPFDYKHSDFTKTLAIHVDLFSKEYSIALISPYYVSDSDCAILDNDVLTVLQDHAITQINITDGSITRHIKLDCFGSNFAIYKVEKGYIIYGEIEITMLDFNFAKKWFFSGKDIFVSVSGKLPFEIKENSICLHDFDDNCYEIDFDGNLIK